MTYRAIDVANWFINRFGEDANNKITHLKVQKLLYFAEAWCQVLLDRELFSEQMEAWAHGPVVREVYKEFADYGWDHLNPTNSFSGFDDDVEDVLFQVLETYGEASAKTLEHLTHQDKPWIDARGGIAPEARCTNIIPKQEIKDWFIKKYGDELNG